MENKMRKNLIAIALMSFPVVAMSALSRFGGIALSYDKEDEVPEAHKELYTERDGKWVLTGVAQLDHSYHSGNGGSIRAVTYAEIC
jgi:hypothetical protein